MRKLPPSILVPHHQSYELPIENPMAQSSSRESVCTRSQPSLEQRKKFLFAAVLGDFSGIRHLIEQTGLHPDTTVEGKPTAICYAALKQDNCLLSYLLKLGANPNYRDRIGMTPLHYAALGGSPYCLADLVHHGAILDQENNAGESALGVIRNRSDLYECAELLKRYGARQHGNLGVRAGFH